MTGFSFILFVFAWFSTIGNCAPPYCLPTNKQCWPTAPEISTFQKTLSGELVQPSDKDYNNYIAMTQDLLYRKQYPEFIVVCKQVTDIQSSVRFASSHNIQISIMSTGHSYSGRNTANNSLQIVLSNMKNYKINGNKESITAQTGITQGPLYSLVSPYIMVGGDDPSVGIAGSSLRGGHSPLGPAFGLMSDFTSEYFIVDANADIVRVYNTSGKNQTIDDLFWSLRGGGGSTFGVIVNITFLLHAPVKGYVFTCMHCTYDFTYENKYIGDVIFNNLWQSIRNGSLDQNWGGYLNNFGAENVEIDVYYYGDETTAKKNGKVFENLAYPYDYKPCGNHFTVYQTFAEFQTQFPARTGGYYLQLWNDLIPKENLTAEYTNTLLGFYNSTRFINTYRHVICYTFQGGKINSFSDDYTAVTPAFRHNQFEAGHGIVWEGEFDSRPAIKEANKWEGEFRKFSAGKYSNEENRACGDGCDWKQLFWGPHYDRLLKVKQTWDPNQVFWCNHCVGSDQ